MFGIAPTAKAAKVVGQETGMHTDTVAKLLHEWARPDGPGSQWRLPSATTVIVDEAGMLSTPDLYRLTQLATGEQWRLVLVGDPRQLQAVGRGGMFAEICATGRTIELERDPPLHQPLGSRRLAAATPRRPTRPRRLRDAWSDHPRHLRRTPGHDRGRVDATHAVGETVAITAATNDHVDAINCTIRQLRARTGDTDTTTIASIADGVVAVGDIVATRRNQRQLHTTSGDTSATANAGPSPQSTRQEI